jgi:hypothetical protein
MFSTWLPSVFLWKKKDPNTTAMPVIAIVTRSRFREYSGGGCCLCGTASLSACLSSLEDATLVSPIPLQLDSWLYLSRNLMYLWQRWQSSVRFPHTSWCSARSVAGRGNSQKSHVTILRGQFSPCLANISRSILSLHIKHSTGAWVSEKCSSASFIGTISPQILHRSRLREQWA